MCAQARATLTRRAADSGLLGAAHGRCSRGGTVLRPKICFIMPIRCLRGSSTVNRGHEHHRSIKRCSAREGRPRRFGGTQRDSGT